MSFFLNIAGFDISCEIVDDQCEDPDVSVTVTRDQDETDLVSHIRKDIEERYWPLHPSAPRDKLREHFILTTPTGDRIDVYSFMTQPLSAALVESMSETVGTFAVQLCSPNLLRSCQTIVLKDGNVKTTWYEPEPLQGKANAMQSMMEILTSAMISPMYRGLPCPEVVGTMLHLLERLCLDSVLASLWRSHQAELGWRETDVTHRRPVFPTISAACTQDDDRADSVVAYVLGLLDDLMRDQLISVLLDRVGGVASCDVQTADVKLPIPSKLRIYIQEVADKSLRRGVLC